MDSTTMTEYTIATNDAKGFREVLFCVDAESVEMAARFAGMDLNRRDDGTIPGGLHVLRTTGIHGKSGWFQGYVPGYGADSNSTGPAFHVM